MNLINKRLKKRGSSKFLRRKLAISLNDSKFQEHFEVPDFNQQYQFGINLLDEGDYDNWEDDCDKIYDYLHDMSSNEERLQAIVDLGIYEDEEDIEDMKQDEDFWKDGELIDEEILPALAECLHNNTLPAIWKGLLPQLQKSYFAADWRGNCHVSENDFKELKRCWEKVPAVVDEMIQYIKDNNIKYEDWDNVSSSLINSGRAKIAAISSSDIWNHYVATVNDGLIHYVIDYLRSGN